MDFHPTSHRPNFSWCMESSQLLQCPAWIQPRGVLVKCLPESSIPRVPNSFCKPLSSPRKKKEKKKGSERNHFNIGSWELYGFEKRRNKRIGYKWGERGCNRKFGKNEGPQILRSRPTVEYGCSPSLYLTFLEHHITSVHITGPIQLSYWGPILPYWWESSSQSFLGFLTLPFPGPTSEPRGGVVGVPSGCQTTEMVLGIPLSPTIPPVAGSETCDCFSRKLGTQGSSPLMPRCSSEPIFSGILNPGILAPWHFCLQVSPSSLSTLPSLPLLSRR